MYERIAVPIDGSPTSNKALVAALNLASGMGGRARLRLLHVVDESALISGMDSMGSYPAELFQAIRDDGARIIEDAMKIAAAAGVEADSVIFDNPGQRLGETVAAAVRAWPADLVVVGTHGRRGIAHMLLGSGAEQIIRLAPVPVLVVRSPEKPEEGPP
jgi:nucleotide-binding universal stress UspA family protein